MNNPHSPLVPQGSLLEQKNQGRARVKIAVLFVLAVHGVGLMALLMQGCRRDDAETLPPEVQTPITETNIMPDFVEPTNVVVDPFPPLTDANYANTATNPTPVEPVTGPVTTSYTPPAQTTEHRVLKGESFATIAKKFGISTKALMDANPGIEPTKLQINQRLVIPAPTSAPAPTASVDAPSAAPADGMRVYQVVSGDTLSRIASQNNTTVKAIRSANNLKTDRIVVGQKLKIPTKSGTGTGALN